jgi:N utilization substance protein B
MVSENEIDNNQVESELDLEMDPEVQVRLSGKRLARVLAVQAVYCHYALKEDREFKYSIYDVMTSYKNSDMAEEINDADEKRLIKICRKVEEDVEKIDNTIGNHISKDWTVSRLPLLILCIMRSAIAEFLYTKLDKSVIINEYVEITKLFNHDGEAGFVNKVLDSAITELDSSF